MYFEAIILGTKIYDNYKNYSRIKVLLLKLLDVAKRFLEVNI